MKIDLNNLDEQTLQYLQQALEDKYFTKKLLKSGNINVPDGILLSKNSLTEEELVLLKEIAVQLSWYGYSNGEERRK